MMSVGAKMAEPLAIDLFCGLGGWTEGLLAEGYYVVGFDIERHDYGEGKRYPAQLILQDVLTIHGRQFKDAALIVASPPCQEYSYMAMPWSRAKAKRAEYLSGERDRSKLTALFDACFRIQREAIEAAGHFIPLVVENVRGAQEWVGRSRWNFGSFHLWGDVPALMPMTNKIHFKIDSPHLWLRDPKRANGKYAPNYTFQSASVDKHITNSTSWPDCIDGTKCGGDWFGSYAEAETGHKTHGMNWSNRELRGQDFTRIAGRQAQRVVCDCGHSEDDHEGGSGAPCSKCSCINPIYTRHDGIKGVPHRPAGHWTNPAEHVSTEGIRVGTESNAERASGLKNGNDWFGSGKDCSEQRRHGSKSSARKAASAAVAKIPLPLARYLARVYRG